MRTIFHGSKNIIEKPQFGVGNPRNDYGLGFYCTEHLEMAKEWAVGFNHSGYANEYLLNDASLKVLDLDSEGFTILHWLAVLLQNRYFDVRAPLANEAREYILEQFSVNLRGVDIVEGYRADDSYFSFAQDFISGAISYRQLGHAMHLGSLGRQVVLVSKKAFSRVEFKSAEYAPKEEWLPRRELRDSNARSAYFDKVRNARKPGDLFIMQIIDENLGPDDERLR